MGRRIIKVREFLRRVAGKPGRRSGVERRKGLEKKGHSWYAGFAKVDTYTHSSKFGEKNDGRSGKDRRKS